MTDPVDLEIDLRRAAENAYGVSMRLSQPRSEAESRVGPAGDRSITFDLPALQAAGVDPDVYGRLLSRALFANPEVLAGFQQARATAQAMQVPLRIRLLIVSDAPELHSLYWETLRDPEDRDSTLFTGEDVLFSRFISSGDLNPVTLRPRGNLKALAAVANPSDLADYGLAPVDAQAELSRARLGLGDLPVTSLVADGRQFCTLESILETLRDGSDILYLVAHGIFAKDQPWLLLEGADGKASRVAGRELADRIGGMQTKPRLIVLASCESAGKGTGAALQALGPRLAEAGVPAVVAMQGSISMGTVARFMPIFFKELRRDGRIDRAMSVARETVKNESDFWMPVLFMRLKNGRIWSEEAREEAKPTVHIQGDTYNVSNISNSNVNLGSTLINVTQAGSDILDASAKQELKRLIGELNEALKKTTGAQQEVAGAVDLMVADLAENLAREHPNRARIRNILVGLEQAAGIAGKGLPEVPPLAGQIVSLVSKALEV